MGDEASASCRETGPSDQLPGPWADIDLDAIDAAALHGGPAAGGRTRHRAASAGSRGSRPARTLSPTRVASPTGPSGADSGADSRLFYLVVAASFVEISAAHYTDNLTRHFADSPEATRWLREVWQPEEIGHGEILRAYSLRAWPDFPWEAAYADFFAEYRAACCDAALESSRALEMAARCVVETSTATFYHMLADCSPEPVLREIAARIRRDEARHYKYFRQYFLDFNQDEGIGRLRVVRTLHTRLSEAEADDAWYAIKHIHAHRHGRPPTPAEYRELRAGLRALFRRHYPYGQAVRMLLHVLGLRGAPRKAAELCLVPVLRLALMR